MAGYPVPPTFLDGEERCRTAVRCNNAIVAAMVKNVYILEIEAWTETAIARARELLTWY